MDHLDSPDWIKNEKWTINHLSKENNKCFQSSGKIKKDSQRITKITNFLNKYNSKGINFSSEKDIWKKYMKSIRTIAINVFYAITKKKILGLWWKR